MSGTLWNWSTAAAPAASAIAYWNELLAENVMQFDIRSDVRRAFRGHLRGARLAGQRSYLISAENRQQGEHLLTTAGAGRHDEVFLLIQTRQGRFRLRTGHGDIVVDKGDCTLVSGVEGFRFSTPELTSCLVVRFERDWLRARLAGADDCAGRHIDGSAGWGGTLSSALWNIDPNDAAASDPGHTDLAAQLASLLGLAVRPEGTPASRSRRAAQARIISAIERHFDDSALCPAAVALELGISPRYLHSLLAERRTTFNRELYRIRLERAAQMLADPGGAGMSVTEIAHATGFADAGHFSRRFRARFGAAPSAFRRRTG